MDVTSKSYLRISEVAEIINVDRSTIFRWIEKGYLQSSKFPSGTYRISKQDLQDFIKTYKKKEQFHRIIVIDDDLMILEIMKEMLESIEPTIEVKTCENELEALMIIGDLKPDMIFIDYKLKDVDGITVATRIRENEKFKDVPIVLVSGVIDDVEYKKFGLKAFIRKPFKQEDIEKVVKNYLVAVP